MSAIFSDKALSYIERVSGTPQIPVPVPGTRDSYELG